MRTIVTVITMCLLAGCAQDRPLKPVLSESRRLKKAELTGTYHFLKTITSVKYAGTKFAALVPGQVIEGNRLVQIIPRETTLDVVAIDPLFSAEREAERTRLVARFKAANVDVLRKQNPDGSDTHEEEITETRRPWAQRELVVPDLGDDLQDPYKSETRATTPPDSVFREGGGLRFTVARQLVDDTLIEETYSLVPYRPSPTFQQRRYDREWQTRFGFFKTSSYVLDAADRVTRKELREWINRWDLSKPIEFRLVSFPSRLVPAARDAVKGWNDAFEAAVGKRPVVLNEKDSAVPGDLATNVLRYDDTPAPTHGILGYAPVVTNPRTGEIIKADVILYGGILRRAIESESRWREVGEIDPATLEQRRPDTRFRIAGSPQTDVEALRQTLYDEYSKNITPLTEDFVQTIRESDPHLADEDLERRILGPLLAHEMGHALGLRHNFMGSTDAAHFGTALSSSVMDYGFHPSDDPEGPGLYDREALRFGYGADDDVTRKALRDANYYFCTDENILSSGDAFCNQYDTGTSLTELVDNSVNRYFTSWIFNNARRDQVFFGGSREEYLAKVGRFLTPIRLAHDYAESALAAHASGKLASLWTLLRQRIEADPNSVHRKKLRVSDGLVTDVKDGKIRTVAHLVEKEIDLDKIAAAVADARSAEEHAFRALERVVFQARPDYDSVDQVNRELQIRGVLLDKLLAVRLVASNLPDPLGQGRNINLFNSLGAAAVGDLFLRLVSDTMNVGAHLELAGYDASLRDSALGLFVDELAVRGASAKAKQLLTIEKLRPRDTKERDAIDVIRRQMVELYRAIYRGDAGEDQRREWEIKLNELERQRAAIPFAYVETHPGATSERYYRAPTTVAELGMDTLSGRLIRDNINVTQDRRAAAALAVEDIRANPKLAATVRKLQAFMEASEGSLAEEQLLLEKIYKAFEPK